jgi:hypothetical protein
VAILYWLVPLALQLLLIIHVIKTGRNTLWIFLLVFLPVVGGLAYLIVEVLPGIGRSRAARAAGNAVARAIQPSRRRRELESLLALQDTVRNRLDLAEEYLAAEEPHQAVEVLRHCLAGVHASDPELRRCLSRALLGCGRPAEALPLLESLAAEGRLEAVSDRLLLLRARTEGGSADPLEAYRGLYESDRGMEAGYWYAACLVSRGKREQAEGVVRDMREQLRRFPQFKRTMGQDWLAKAARLLKAR